METLLLPNLATICNGVTDGRHEEPVDAAAGERGRRREGVELFLVNFGPARSEFGRFVI